MRRLFWVKEGLRYVVAVLGASFLYSLFMMIAGSEKDWIDTLTMATMYLVMFSAIMALVFNMTLYQSVLPLTISFGCLRKEALVGLQIYRLTVLIPVTAITAVLAAMVAPDIGTQAWIIVVLEIAAYLFCTSIGGLIGPLSGKLSKTLLGVLYGVAMLAFMVILAGGIIVVFIMEELNVLGWVAWLVLGVAVAVYGLCSIAEIRGIKHLCVR